MKQGSDVSTIFLPVGFHPTGRAKVGSQISRGYTYAYLAACPETGETYLLILLYADESCMDVFMKNVSEVFNHYRIIKVMDRASWHTGKKTGRQENIIPLFQPPYSPELNPVECLCIR
jgi:hypothetical protein